MAFDSTANLLFTIGADSSDAQTNIQRFRSVLAKDLGQMKAEFSDWSARVFGDLSSLKGAMTAGVATLAAGALAVGGAMWTAAEKTARFAEEIEDGMDKTGLSAEQMSELRFAAEQTGLQYGSLVSSLVKFERVVVEAASSGEAYRQTFGRMGISQAEVKRGTEDILPLLMRTADSFKSHSSTVEKAAMSQALFSRGGAELLEFLGLGAAGIGQLSDRARELGVVLTEQDVVAAKAFKLASQELHAALNGVWFSIGKAGLPVLKEAAILMEAMIQSAMRPRTTWVPFADFFGNLPAEIEKARKSIDASIAAATAASGVERITPGEQKAKKTKEEYYGLSSVLDQIRMQLAGLAGDEVRIYEQAAQYRTEIEKAATELLKRRKEKALSDEDYFREFDAWTQGLQRVDEYVSREIAAINDKRTQAAIQATLELEGKLEGLRDQSYENQRRAAEKEIALLVQKLQKEKQYTEVNAALVQQIRQAMSANIDRQQLADFQSALVELQQQYAEMVTARMTSYERFAFAYEQDLVRFSAVEEQKTLVTARNEEERQIIRQQFELNRQTALNAYGNNLMVLQNSQGWQGVFGDYFAQRIQGNERLLREWSESAGRGQMMVHVSLDATRQSAQRTFAAFAQGMGQNIAQAIVYRKSIGDAMRAAATETISAFAAESMIAAIVASGYGFYYLARQMYTSAANAFIAAGVFASVGTAAAVAGRAIAPKESGSSASSGGSTASTTGASGETGSQESGKARVSIVINGHVIGRTGVEELAEIINDAVVNRDVRLVATQTKQRGRVSP